MTLTLIGGRGKYDHWKLAFLIRWILERWGAKAVPLTKPPTHSSWLWPVWLWRQFQKRWNYAKYLYIMEACCPRGELGPYLIFVIFWYYSILRPEKFRQKSRQMQNKIARSGIFLRSFGILLHSVESFNYGQNSGVDGPGLGWGGGLALKWGELAVKAKPKSFLNQISDLRCWTLDLSLVRSLSGLKHLGGSCVCERGEITWRGSLCRKRWWACRGKCRRGAPESIFNLEKKKTTVNMISW